MKPHPRIRKTIKWGGAAVTVLLVVVWVGSYRWFYGWNDSGSGRVYFAAGGVEITLINGAALPRTLSYGRGDYSLSGTCLLPRYLDLRGARAAIVPLWLPLLVVAGSAIAAWRLDTLARRRAKLNLCPKCGYDRTGLASKDAKCPECGLGLGGERVRRACEFSFGNRPLLLFASDSFARFRAGR